MKLAGFNPAGVLCELTNGNGSMARWREVMEYGKKYELPIVLVEDLASSITQENPFEIHVDECQIIVK